MEATKNIVDWIKSNKIKVRKSVAGTYQVVNTETNENESVFTDYRGKRPFVLLHVDLPEGILPLLDKLAAETEMVDLQERMKELQTQLN